MLIVENIHKNFGDFGAVRGLSFSIKKGEVVGFLGPNGAGKTTTLRLLTGFLPASSGRCLIDDIDIAQNPKLAQEKIGYLPESAALYTDMEVTDYLHYVGQLRQMNSEHYRTRLDEVMTTCGLTSVAGKVISSLSKGYRQRVGLAQALLHDPEVLLLDEPTVGLDPNQIAEIRELIKKIGRTKTILLSTHILPEVEQICSRVIIIASGRIVGEGSPQDLTEKTFGHPTYQITFKGDSSRVAEALSTLPGLIKTETQSTEAGLWRGRLTLDAKALRDDLFFDFAVKHALPLVQLHRETRSLEDVFKQLTR